MVKLATICHFFPLLFPATVFALLLVNSVTNEESSQKPRIFRVNLDLNPSQRWRPVLEVYKKDVIPRIVDMARSYVPNKLRGPVFGLFSRLAHFLPKEYGEELAGIAEYLGDIGVTLGELVALNLLYDLTDFAHLASRISTNQTVNSSEESDWLPPSLGCTSIVAAREDGTILHARNLDYGMTKLLSDATILVDFVRGGQVKYTSVSFVLFIGVLTGQRPNAFTVSLNARYSGGPWDNLLMELLTRFHHPVAFELRRVLETAPDYVSALAQLSRVPMIAPAYIIVGGMAGDGAIITRDRLGAADIFFLDYLHHRWFQLETNYDPWKKAGDKRRKYGRRFMKQIGHRNISASTLFGRVLTRPPIWNKETVYSTVMSAEQPQLIYNTTVVWKNDVAEESNPI